MSKLVGLWFSLVLIITSASAQEKINVQKPVAVPSPAPELRASVAALQATSAKSPGIELFPAEVTVAKNTRVVIVGVTASVKYGWFVINSNTKKPIQYFEPPNVPALFIFPNDVEEKIEIYAYGGTATDPYFVKSVINVKDTAPTDVTPVGPTKVLPVGAVLNVTFIHDSDAERVNPSLADVLVSPEVINGLVTRGHKRWVLNTKAKDDASRIATSGYGPYITSVGSLPMVIVQDSSGHVIDQWAVDGTDKEASAKITAFLTRIDNIAPKR